MDRRLVLKATLLLALLSAAGIERARSQDYPTRNITLVVRQAAGGGNDILARMFAEKLTQRFGKAVIVENRAGAGGMIGVSSVAKATPDGYTLVLLGNPDVVNQYLHANVSYNVQRDFAPISQLIWAPMVLLSNPAVLPPKTLPDLVAYAKANPNKLSYGSPGIGTIHHISMEMLKKAADIDIAHVPYRGALPSVNDLLAGQIPLVVAATIAILPLLRDGRIHAIGTADVRRSPVLPDVPTYGESGYPGFDIASSSGVAAPAGTPPAIVARLSKEIQEIAAEPAFRQRLLDLGYSVVASTPEGYAKQIDDDVKQFSKMIPELNLAVR